MQYVHAHFRDSINQSARGLPGRNSGRVLAKKILYEKVTWNLEQRVIPMATQNTVECALKVYIFSCAKFTEAFRLASILMPNHFIYTFIRIFFIPKSFSCFVLECIQFGNLPLDNSNTFETRKEFRSDSIEDLNYQLHFKI